MLWSYIKEHAMHYPEQRIYNSLESLTFTQLIENAEKLSKCLTRQKYGIICQSDLLCATALLACMAAGVTAVPLSNRYGREYNKRIVETMRISAMLMEEEGRLVVRESDSSRDIEPDLEDVAWILSTSGTTGKPKGVMLTKEAILQNLIDSDSFFLSHPGDKLLAGRGFFHCSSLTGELLMSLIRGVDIDCYSEGFAPMPLLKEMEKENITVYSGTPTVFYYLCKTMLRRSHTVRLRYCNIGGEMMDQQSLSIIRQALPETQIIHSYGLTETCSRATYLNISQKIADVRCVGGTIPSLAAFIVDENGRERKANQEGEVVLAGKSMLKGYYLDQKATERVLENGYLKTGDMGWIDAKGMLHICGRKDDMIIRAGVNIYPKEIERTLKSNRYIRDVKVYAQKGHITRKLAAAVVLEEGCPLSPKEILTMCRSSLSHHQILDQIQIVRELEFSQAGKVCGM